MKKGISVIVCCYNSANRLPETIKHIANQKSIQDDNWEVIIVNNNSNDNTFNVAKKEWEKYSLSVSFKVLNEPKLGLSNARRTAIQNSKYEYVLFCDDDNWLCPEYISMALEIIDTNKEIGLLGGRCDAVCEVDEPEWFDKMKFAYAIGVQGDKSGDVTSKGFMWGAGVVVRANVLRKIYGNGIHSLLLGREGKVLNAGDDAEISCWFLMLGYKFWYDERLYFKHFISKERLTETYVKGLVAGFDRSTPIMSAYYRIIDFQRDFLGRKSIDVFIKAIYKFVLIKLNILPFRESLPRLRDNIQISSNSFISFNKEIAIVQRKVFNRLLKLKLTIE